MASYTIAHPGNMALETTVWSLSCDEAAGAAALLDTRRGTYWHLNLVKATQRATRTRSPMVQVYTAGFSSGELSNALYAAGYAVDPR